jgi:hypothetical protein
VADIHIKVVDGALRYPNALTHGIEENRLWVQLSESDTITFSPSYWQAYIVDPQGDVEPFGLKEDRRQHSTE